jgi:hypothetical protein
LACGIQAGAQFRHALGAEAGQDIGQEQCIALSGICGRCHGVVRGHTSLPQKCFEAVGNVANDIGFAKAQGAVGQTSWIFRMNHTQHC